mmetsp:Transcript_15968/g.39231  ORF Transcript_15968/g.39231 Transcript_15968/m.39231 type:complete len:140 (+) Transcript_15968:210-629(+)
MPTRIVVEDDEEEDEVPPGDGSDHPGEEQDENEDKEQDAMYSSPHDGNDSDGGDRACGNEGDEDDEIAGGDDGNEAGTATASVRASARVAAKRSHGSAQARGLVDALMRDNCRESKRAIVDTPSARAVRAPTSGLYYCT